MGWRTIFIYSYAVTTINNGNDHVQSNFILDLHKLLPLQGGPPNLKGVWDTKGEPGIRWPDGNKWTVKN